MQCDYFDAGACRSCTWMGRPYDEQLAALQEHVAGRLPTPSGLHWLEPFAGRERGFRNKAKMVVAGTVDEPTLGILDPSGAGTDLRHCGLHEAALHDALPTLAAFVTRAGLQPYDVPTRRGELKHVVATVSPDGELMVRWVLRSTESLARLRKHLGWLQERLPRLMVASANLQPLHQAVLEGPEEVLLTEQATLPMRLAGLDLRLRPQGFFQTNSAVAAALYEQAGDWFAETAPGRVLDLYCGVGGFALTAARAGVRDVVGVEVSPDAVAGATAAARAAGVARSAGPGGSGGSGGSGEAGGVRFVVDDATADGPARRVRRARTGRPGGGEPAAARDR